MTPERWAQIEELFHRAADCESAQRTSLLEEACRTDPDLRREVDALLSSDRSTRDHVQSAVSHGLNAFAFSLAGEVVSHYRILDGLSGGGMGLVYRAEDIRLGRLVALKFLPEESANNPVALARFEREARAVSAVEHPNICPIYEFGEHDGRPFLVMQLLEGQTFRELLEKRRLEVGKSNIEPEGKREIQSPKTGSEGIFDFRVSKFASHTAAPLPLTTLVDIATQIAAGLEVAHHQGIIHRDIKPANIFVTREGQAKILDFGLAKLTHSTGGTSFESYGQEPVLIDPKDGHATQPPDPMLSRTGVAMGTAGYMSPEQARGEKLDARTDLFSFGLVLYEMATGQRAFQGDTAPMLRDAILERAPIPVRQLNSQVSVKLEKIIHKALEKDLETRYRTVGEMRTDLETVKREMRPRTLPTRWVLASAAVLVFLIAGSIFWIARHRPTFPQTLPELKLQQLTVNSSENPVKSGAISPDGKFLAYVDRKGLHVKKVGSGEAQSVPAPEGLNNSDVTWEIIPTNWFPNSKRFLVNAHPATETDNEWSSRTASIWEVSIAGGPPRKLRDHAMAWSVSPDGLLISFGTDASKLGDRELWLMDQDGERARVLYQADQNKAICCLYFFPDGQRVSYISTDSSGDTLVARDLKGGPVTTLLQPDELKRMGDAAWLPDGRLIYSDPGNWFLAGPDRPCNYWTLRLDTRTGAVLERPKRLTNWVGFWMNEPSITADGKRMAFLESSYLAVSSMADVEAGGTHLVNVRRFPLEEGGEDAVVDFTADNKSVIVLAGRRDHYSFRKQSLNSDTQETIASADGGVENAFLSPDGKWVVAQAHQLPDRGLQLMRIPMTGGPPEMIFAMPELSFSMCARPPSNVCLVAEPTDDHKQAVFTYFDPVKGRGRELTRLDLSARSETIKMSVSNDGTKLAFALGPEGPIQIRRLGGGLDRVIRTKELGRLGSFGWAADGKGLFVIRNLVNARAQIVHVNFQGNAKVLWTCGADVCFAGPSPDGRHFAIQERKTNANMWMMENF